MAANKSSPLSLPDNVVGILAAEDRRKGFPLGTMQSLMMQESSGKPQYLNDPTTYHYGVDDKGRRGPKNSDVISTAFGPFGLLESTAKDPGYGVKPLADKTSFAEHARFAADYLDARSQSGGSLSAGLAGYGEGDKYSRQVMRRIPDQPVQAVAEVPPAMASLTNTGQAPVAVAQATQAPGIPLQPAEAAPVPPAAPVVAAANPWDEFQARLREEQAKANAPAPTVASLDYGNQDPNMVPMIRQPDFLRVLGNLGQNVAINFGPFGSSRGRA